MATESSRRGGTALAVASLFGSLVYGATLSAYVLDIVGTTTAATSAITAAFLLTAAVGARVGRVGYGRAEAGLVVYCVGFPFLLPWLAELYLALAPPILEASTFSRNAARFAFATIAVGVPGYLIGVTLRTITSLPTLTAGAALGLLTATRFLIPGFGLAASTGVATLVKLALPLMPPPKQLEASHDDDPAPLPWKSILIVITVIGSVVAIIFFRTLLAFALQYPALLPAIGGAALVTAVLKRRGVELPRSTPRWITAFAAGVLVYALADSSGTSVLFVVAIGALAGAGASSPKKWVLPSLAVAATLTVLALGAGIVVDILAAFALGLVLSVTVRSLGSVGDTFTVSAAGAVAALALAAPYLATAPADDDSSDQHARIASLFTPERTRALTTNVAAVDTLGVETVVDVRPNESRGVCAKTCEASCSRALSVTTSSSPPARRAGSSFASPPEGCGAMGSSSMSFR